MPVTGPSFLSERTLLFRILYCFRFGCFGAWNLHETTRNKSTLHGIWLGWELNTVRSRRFRQYISVVQFYDAWLDRKLLIFYDHLMKKPKLDSTVEGRNWTKNRTFGIWLKYVAHQETPWACLCSLMPLFMMYSAPICLEILEICSKWVQQWLGLLTLVW